MIYVPNDSYQCYVIYNADTIRAYKTQPYASSETDYIDYYVNSHYMYKEGTQRFNTNFNVECISKDRITTDYYYRNDFDSILIIFMCILSFCYFVISKMIGAFFKGFRK